MLTIRGLTRVLGDLAEMGFDAEWGVISAEDCGAVHERERAWIVAHANQVGLCGAKTVRELARERLTEPCLASEWWANEPRKTPREAERGVVRMVYGFPARMDRIRALGNAQVPLCAATAWRILGGC